MNINFIWKIETNYLIFTEKSLVSRNLFTGQKSGHFASWNAPKKNKIICDSLKTFSLSIY